MFVLRPIVFAAVLVASLAMARVAEAFRDTGHHVVAVLAFNSLEPDRRKEVVQILRANLRFDEDFMPPASIESDPAAVARWQIGVAGEWPDIVCAVPSLTRPNWHHQLGATLVIGNLHAVLDGLLGRNARPGDVQRPVAEITSDPALVPAAQAASSLVTILDEAKRPSQPRRTSLSRAHAHNDYLHERPLFDALENGFDSVEADVFLVDGELLVAHEPSELSRDRTLTGLYLDPLRKIAEENGGYVQLRDREFLLHIDIKSDAEATYRQLAELLTEYRGILSEVTEGKVTKRAVSVVISGNRPFDLIRSQATRFVAIDGRLSDLDSDEPAHLIPLISDRWPSHFTWRGEGDFPEAERAKLERIVRKAHEARRKVRLWATPENEKMWAALRDAGVDFINTDDLSGLATFLERSRNDQAEDGDVGAPRE